MAEVISDQDIDNLVWSIIKNSQNPNDFIGFIRHARDREVDYETAYSLALKNWGNREAKSLFPDAVTSLQVLAQAGCTSSMFHLGVWYRMGYGVPVDSEKGLAWYKSGMELMDGRCFMGYAFSLINSDPQTASALFQRSVELGHTFAHSYWADLDKEHYMEHMALGAKDNEPLGVYFYAFELLRRAEKEHEIENALDIMKRAANLGATNAAFQLGMIFFYGEHGKTEDKAAAEYWFKKGIRRGSVACLSALGKHLLIENPDRKNEGLKYLQRAAVLGDANAQYYLGKHLMEFGESEERRKEGLFWLEGAALSELKYVYYLLGENYRKGVGVEKNLEIAANWYKRGAEKGETDCQCAYGLALIYGDGVQTDPERAHNLFHAAYLQQSDWGTYLLGMSYDMGHGVIQDRSKALQYFKEGAKRGDINSSFALGIAYLFGDGMEEDYPAALKWFKVSADRGSARAKAYIGLMFLNGSGVQSDIDKAKHWLNESAEQGCALAMRELGDLYFKGERVALDLELAKRWMSKAAANGDPVAVEWIKNNCPEKPEWLNNLLQSTSTNLEK